MARAQHRAVGDGDFDMSHMLNGGHEFVFHGPPPRAGNTLHGTQRLDRVYEKVGRNGVMTFYEVVEEFRTDEGELVAESRSTTIQLAPPQSASA
jgi:hypothetical protein